MNGGGPASPERGAVLVAHADAALRDPLCDALGAAGHQAARAHTAGAVLDQLAAAEFDVVATGLHFPDAAGLDLLVEIRSRAPETRVVLLANAAELQSAADAVVHGIDRILVLPIGEEAFLAAVTDALGRHREARRSQREVAMLEARLRQRDTESKIWVLRAAHALTAAVEAKDPYTAGHARRVTAYAMTIAEVTGGVDLLSFRLAGDLHDVGKIGIPDRVLCKPGSLSRRELAMVRQHPDAGVRILRPLIDDKLVLAVVRHHHERWDGTGYPDALAGKEIPLAARILAVADALDAMTSARAWRGGADWEHVAEAIRGLAGTQFDPAVVEAFIQALPILREHFRHFRAAYAQPRAPGDTEAASPC